MAVGPCGKRTTLKVELSGAGPEDAMLLSSVDSNSQECLALNLAKDNVLFHEPLIPVLNLCTSKSLAVLPKYRELQLISQFATLHVCENSMELDVGESSKVLQRSGLAVVGYGESNYIGMKRMDWEERR